MNNTAIATKATPARKPRRTTAVLKKQLRDTLKNKMVLLQFVLFPLVAFIFTKLVGGALGDGGNTMFAAMFAPMYAGMVPMATTAGIISEEKETHTLKVLMMAGVKPWQYLLGTGSYVVFCTLLGGLSFGLMCGHGGVDLAVFMAGMLGGILCSLLGGFAVGLLAKNQMSANTIATPIAMVAAFLPMLGMFNETMAKVSRFVYTQQISDLLQNPAAGLSTESILILAANFAVVLVIFILAFRKEGRAK